MLLPQAYSDIAEKAGPDAVLDSEGYLRGLPALPHFDTIVPVERIAAWVISIAVIALAWRLPRRVLTVLMLLGLALLAVGTIALFTL